VAAGPAAPAGKQTRSRSRGQGPAADHLRGRHLLSPRRLAGRRPSRRPHAAV